MMKNPPKISIVTVVYNAEMYISATVESIINQSFENYEYIIIDGRSTDQTLEKIKYFKHKITHLISEKDQGIYDAMNKGIKIASGEWIYFLNAGDCLYSKDTLKELFSNEYKADLVYGSNEANYGYFKRLNKPLPLNQLKIGMVFSHQAMMVKTRLMKSHPFNLSYHLCADYDFIYHLYKSGKNFQKTELIFSTVLADGVSEVDILKVNNERKNIALHYEKGLSKFILGLRYALNGIRLRMILFIKRILPQKSKERLTKMKYR